MMYVILCSCCPVSNVSETTAVLQFVNHISSSVGQETLVPVSVTVCTLQLWKSIWVSTGAEGVRYMWCDRNGLTVETEVLYVHSLKMCCLSLQCRQILSSTDMSLALILLSAKQKSAVNSYSSHYIMSRQKYCNNILKNSHETNSGATVSAVTRVWAGLSGVHSQQRQQIHLNSKMSTAAMGPTKHPMQLML